MAGRVQFGVYELDPEGLELRKYGVPVRLQDQPLQVLTALVERPGEIVTREQLQERIWGKETFVDFDQSLNKAVNRLREALNDDPAQPRYVETVPRRGYRFVAPVTRNGVTNVAEGSTSAEIQPQPPRADKRRIRARAIAAVGGLIASAVLGIGATLRWAMVRKPIVFQTRHVTSGAFCCPTLSPDGKLLAYSAAIAGGVPHIWVQQTAGGDAFAVTNTSEGDYSPSFDPNGTRLVYWSAKEGGVLYLKPTFTGEPRPVGKFESGGLAHFSPGGDRIMYPDDINGLITVSPENGEADFLRDAFLVQWTALWSPAGDRILFYGRNSREPEKPNAWWIGSLASRETRKIVLPDADDSDIANQAVMSWIKDENGEWIVYAISKGFVWKILRIRVSEQGEILDKPEEINSGTGRLSWGSSPWADGKLIYMTVNPTQSIYEIPINRRGDKLGPALQVPLPEGGNYRSPSASRDGIQMVYYFAKPREMSPVFLRNLSTGADHLLEEDGSGASISPDGTKVAFARNCKQSGGNQLRPIVNEFPCSFVIPAAGGVPQQVCEFCNPRGFSSNSSLLLVQQYVRTPAVRDRIDIIDLVNKTKKSFLSSADKPLYHAFFSWDDRWVVFKKLFELKKGQILIAPVRNGMAGGEKEWIAVTDGQHSDDKPQFSADGNTVLFTSTRDGYLCIWAQRLNPVTKRPVGQPFAVEHFHNSEGAYAAMLDNQWFHDLSVARDKVLINLPEVHADVWMTQVR
jgi:DNA-binding winged helix-turn-helix (wHTH) protein/Tol biopolymer transport system component